MKRRTDKLKGLNVEVGITDTQRAILGAYVMTEGFDIMQLLMEDQVNKFNMQLIDTPVNRPDDVLAHHALAKAVAQFYQGLMERIETECQIQQSLTSSVGTIRDPENLINVEEFR